MSRMSRLRLLAIPVAAAAAAVIAAPSAPAHKAAYLGVPSNEFWAAHQDNDVHKPVVDGVYQPNTDTDMSKYVAQAAALSRYTNKSWRNAGPFGGVQDI